MSSPSLVKLGLRTPENHLANNPYPLKFNFILRELRLIRYCIIHYSSRSQKLCTILLPVLISWPRGQGFPTSMCGCKRHITVSIYSPPWDGGNERPWGSYFWGLGAEPPVESRNRAPGQRVWGEVWGLCPQWSPGAEPLARGLQGV